VCLRFVLHVDCYSDTFSWCPEGLNITLPESLDSIRWHSPGANISIKQLEELSGTLPIIWVASKAAFKVNKQCNNFGFTGHLAMWSLFVINDSWISKTLIATRNITWFNKVVYELFQPRCQTNWKIGTCFGLFRYNHWVSLILKIFFQFQKKTGSAE
jgi:hypothetical protein